MPKQAIPPQALGLFASLLTLPFINNYYKNEHKKWQAQMNIIEQQLEPHVNHLRVLNWEHYNAEGHLTRLEIITDGEVTADYSPADSLYLVTRRNLQVALENPEYQALIKKRQDLHEPFENGIPATSAFLGGLVLG